MPELRRQWQRSIPSRGRHSFFFSAIEYDSISFPGSLLGNCPLLLKEDINEENLQHRDFHRLCGHAAVRPGAAASLSGTEIAGREKERRKEAGEGGNHRYRHPRGG